MVASKSLKHRCVKETQWSGMVKCGGFKENLAADGNTCKRWTARREIFVTKALRLEFFLVSIQSDSIGQVAA